MPDAHTLEIMYGVDYASSFEADPGIVDPKSPQRVLDFLARQPRGTFLDYGCGEGGLLAKAQEINWTAVGVELDGGVARRVREKTGADVLVASALSSSDPIADVVHLGDVIEHLTDPDRDFPNILGLLKPGGYLIAQGPLENNSSLFIQAVRLARSIKGTNGTEMAPYHVMLATSRGQRGFFKRFGLHEIEYSLEEVAWPAPACLRLGDLKRPRAVALFALRRVSQMASALRPQHWGNRYFYVGRFSGSLVAHAKDRAEK
jgi:SAM-dependent methyltransferase